jgi:hypothetical protein
MKTRLSSRVVALCLLLITAGLGFNSCKPDLVDPGGSSAQFGSIRAMNFVDCGGPFDLFIYQEGSRDTVINRALAYSVGSAYATNLTPGVYTIVATKLNQRDAILASPTKVEVHADEAWSVMFFGQDTPQEVRTVKDQNVTPAADKVYVRFLNTKLGTGDLDLVVDNPANTPLVTVGERQLSSYVEMSHALDTTYALYVRKKDSPTQLVARLAGAAFGPGQFYTVVYSGNDNTCRDTSAEKADTLRLRYFDDNQQGNDLTFPIVQSLRFNIVNGLIPPPVLHKPDQRTYKTAGVVINNDDRFLVPQIAPKQMARTIGKEQGDKVIVGGFYTVPWTEAIQVSMYANVYEGNNVVENKRGIKLVDLRAGNRKQIKSDVPFSIIIMDTVRSDMTNGVVNVDSAKIVSYSVPLPDVPVTGKAQIVVVNGLAPLRTSPVNTGTLAKLYVNGTAPTAFTTFQKAPKYDMTDVNSGPVTIKAEIGRSATDIKETIEKTFDAVSGGIYEIVLVGQRGNTTAEGKPEILVIRTNKPSN